MERSQNWESLLDIRSSFRKEVISQTCLILWSAPYKKHKRNLVLFVLSFPLPNYHNIFIMLGFHLFSNKCFPSVQLPVGTWILLRTNTSGHFMIFINFKKCFWLAVFALMRAFGCKEAQCRRRVTKLSSYWQSYLFSYYSYPYWYILTKIKMMLTEHKRLLKVFVYLPASE